MNLQHYSDCKFSKSLSSEGDLVPKSHRYFQMRISLIYVIVIRIIINIIIIRCYYYYVFQMRTPQELWTEETETRSVCHVAMKVSN